jgi:hypothetical protein
MIKRYNIDQSMSDEEEVETDEAYFNDTWCKHEDVEKVENELLESYKSIKENHSAPIELEQQEYCIHCGRSEEFTYSPENPECEYRGWWIIHDKDCIVNKAIEYIKEHS